MALDSKLIIKGGDILKINSSKLLNTMAKKCVGVAELSRRTEVPQSTIIHYTQGKGTRHSIRVIGLISQALEVDPSEITE